MTTKQVIEAAIRKLEADGRMSMRNLAAYLQEAQIEIIGAGFTHDFSQPVVFNPYGGFNTLRMPRWDRHASVLKFDEQLTNDDRDFLKVQKIAT